MRVIAIGYPLPNVEIDNYNVLTAPSYTDYDALIIDPASITRVARELVDSEGEFEAFDGRPVINGPTSAAAVSAADQIRRRGEETRRLLEAGGTVVVFARPNAIQAGLQGFEGCDRYSWLPAPGGLSWGTPYLRAGEGKTVRVAAEDHPLTNYLRNLRSDISYRATFDDRQAEVRQGRVIATGGSGVPIAMEFSVSGGRVLFVPALSDSTGTFRSEAAQELVDVCRRLNAGGNVQDPPWWAKSVAVPGLEQAEAELADARETLSQAEARVATAQEAHDTLEHHRRILWADGPLFIEAVVGALRILGFSVNGGMGEPYTVRGDGEEALLEAESARDEVVEWPYVRLQRRLEERLLKTGEAARGLVVANGKRETDPVSRGDQLAHTLEIACQNYGYTLITGETLFALLQRALGGASEDDLGGIRRRLMRAKGLLSTEAAVGEAEAGTESGPIF